ncbi:MAG: tetratricopeptide repeat protein, partial [Pirellula sp.]
MNSNGPFRFPIAASVLLCAMALILVGCEPAGNKQSSGDVKSKSGTEVTKEQEPKKASSLRALKLLEASRFDDAWEECQKVLLGSPNDPRALYVSAHVLEERKRIDQALAMIDRISISDPEYGVLAHRDALAWCLERSMLQAAEDRARKILEHKPDDYETNKLLAAMLDLQGRRFESSRVLQKLISLGATDLTTLVMALDTVKPVESDELSRQKFQENPKEYRLKGSIAFGALYEKKPDLAESELREIIQSGQATAAHWIGLGQALIDQEKWNELGEWFSQSPKESMDKFPDYWRAIGLWCQQLGENQQAAKCFTQSLELDPMNPLAAGHLAQTLAILGDPIGAQTAEKIFQE